MVNLYTGTPGSGKSLHVAERIYHGLKNHKNYHIICNFQLNIEKLGKIKGFYTYVDTFNITPDFLYKYCRDNLKPGKEHQALLVIDECSLIFNSRDWGISGRKEWLEFFVLHRKLGYDVILICQFDRQIDRQIRAIVEYEYKHRKINNCGIAGKLFGLIAMGSVFVSIEYWYSNKDRLGTSFFRYKNKYGRMYDTYHIFKKMEDGAVSEKGDGAQAIGDPISDTAPPSPITENEMDKKAV